MKETIKEKLFILMKELEAKDGACEALMNKYDRYSDMEHIRKADYYQGKAIAYGDALTQIEKILEQCFPDDID